MNPLPPVTVSSHYTLAPSLCLLRQPCGNYVLMYRGSSVELNAGAAAILELCDGQHSGDAIALRLSPSAAPTPELERDIQDFIAIAAARGWLLRVER